MHWAGREPPAGTDWGRGTPRSGALQATLSWAGLSNEPRTSHRRWGESPIANLAVGIPVSHAGWPERR